MELLKWEDVSLMIDTRGKSSDPPLVLISGATQSMDWWPVEFCELLAAGGLYVIRYDHRDTGASISSRPGHPNYTGVDLATDPLRILDALGIGSAHVLGLSMGGGIAQYLAVTAPERVQTLTLIESSPAGGDTRDLPPPEATLTAAQPRPEPDWADASLVINYRVAGERAYAGTLGFDEQRIRTIATVEYFRTKNLRSALTNHFLVVGDVGANPRAITAPTLIIHSDSDPLFPLAHGAALQQMIPHATLHRVHGMGHEAPPPQVWDSVTSWIINHVLHNLG